MKSMSYPDGSGAVWGLLDVSHVRNHLDDFAGETNGGKVTGRDRNRVLRTASGGILGELTDGVRCLGLSPIVALD